MIGSVFKFLWRALLALLAIAALGVGLLLAALAYGITWDSIELPGVRLEGGQVGLAPLLAVAIDRVEISGFERQDTDDTLPDLSLLGDALRAIDLLDGLVSSIHINEISLGEFRGTFGYREKDFGNLQLQGPDISVALNLEASAEVLLIDIVEYNYHDSSLTVSGQVAINPRTAEARAGLKVTLAELLTVNSDIIADTRGISFKAAGEAPVTEIAPIVRLFELGPEIEPWISDYTRASQYSLESISGSFDYENPSELLQTLRAEIRVEDTQYTFAQGLEPALAPETSVIFEKGVLHIEPHEATFYGQSGGNTWVDIDFTGDNVILTVAVNTRAQASGGVLKLLEYYEIPFPFEQLEGMTDADLDLRIDLETVDISASGHFSSTDSKFLLGRPTLDVDHIDVSLENTVVKINNLAIGLDGLFAANVDGIIDAARDVGELDIELKSFTWKDENLKLVSSDVQPLGLSYRMSPEGDTVEVQPSKWLAEGVEVDVGAFTSAVDINALSGSLSDVRVEALPWARATVSGSFQMEAPYALLSIQLEHFESDTIKMQQDRLEIDVIIDDTTAITSQGTARFALLGTDLRLAPTRVLYSDRSLNVTATGFTLGNRLKGNIQGRNVLSSTRGVMSLRELALTDPDGERNLLSGDLHLSGTSTRYRYQASGQLRANEGFVVDSQGRRIGEYDFTGTVGQEKLDILFNEALRVHWADELSLTMQGIDFYLPALLDAFPTSSNPDSERPVAEQGAGEALKVSLTALDTAIWLDEKRSIPAERITVHYEDGQLNASLIQGTGKARLNYTAGDLLLAGTGFDTKFLDPLLQVANFDGGEVRFRVAGTLDELELTVGIEDTLLRDYKHLNNMLAFINTLPGLLTFNPPNYNAQGLPVSQAYVEANLHDKIIDLQALVVDSDELSLAGAGSIDLGNETTDMTFNLNSGVKKSIERIPLVGYVLTGGKKDSSLTLDISGDLYDPKVRNSAAKDVVTYPLQLIKRTLLLPVHVVDEVNTRGESKSKSKNKSSEKSEFKRVSD